MKFRYRTQSACRIARISRDRFNEAVAAGNYRCAPAVIAGATRVFDESDLIVLFIYARLLEDGMSRATAGNFACNVRECLELESTPEDEQEIIIVRSLIDHMVVFSATTIKNPPIRALSGAGGVFWRMSFDIGNIREIIQRDAEEERKIVGADDEGDDK